MFIQISFLASVITFHTNLLFVMSYHQRNNRKWMSLTQMLKHTSKGSTGVFDGVEKRVFIEH